MPSTSVPRAGSVMPIAPIHSPVSTFGQVARALLGVGAVVEVVHEQHRVREVREREARVGLGELVVDDDRGRASMPAPPSSAGNGDAEEAELAALREAASG